MSWKSRLDKTEEVDPLALQPNPHNWRSHPDEQRKALTAVLGTVGWVRHIIVNSETGHVIDGHARLEEAIEQEQETIPVSYVRLTLDEERVILATLDPLAALAESDFKAHRHLIASIEVENVDLVEFLAKLQPPVSGPVTPVDDEWDGMPAFEQGNLLPFHAVRVNFRDQQAVDAFAQIIGQHITDRTRSLWYPKAELDEVANRMWTHE